MTQGDVVVFTALTNAIFNNVEDLVSLAKKSNDGEHYTEEEREDANKQLSQISTPSEPMGVDKEAVYSDINITLNSGDILVTCTDGLLESLNENGVQYSTESLKKVLLQNSNASAKDISNRVKDDLRRYSENIQQYDDQSLLVIKIQ